MESVKKRREAFLEKIMDEIKDNNGDEVPNGETTVFSDRDESGQNEETVAVNREENTLDKTTVMFQMEDIQRKIRDEKDAIPELEEEELTSEGLTKYLKSIFPEKSEVEQLEINRNFLRDAEPFSLERLSGELKTTGEGLQTGFAGLDRRIRIPNGAVTVIAGAAKHGKSIFMLNLALNMARMYRDKHFLFYTYEESRANIEAKMINMCGEQPFSDRKTAKTNLEWWKHELRNRTSAALVERSETDPAYRGLKNFLAIAKRVHVVDSNYNIVGLIDSMKSFNNILDLGAVFIDYFQGIGTPGRKEDLPPTQLSRNMAGELRRIAKEMQFPLLCSCRLETGGEGAPEYDVLKGKRTAEVRELEQSANLVVGLQSYAQSNYIGSEIESRFESRFYDQPLSKAERMPGTFTDQEDITILRVRVLANREGSVPEAELLFHRDLLKLADLKDEDVRRFKAKFTG